MTSISYEEFLSKLSAKEEEPLCRGETVYISNLDLSDVSLPPAGLKADYEKPRLDLVPSQAILGIAEVLTFGAKKYAENNWRKGFEAKRLYAAALRHILADQMGQHLDPETNLPALDHAICMLIFLRELRRMGRLVESTHE